MLSYVFFRCLLSIALKNFFAIIQPLSYARIAAIGCANLALVQIIALCEESGLLVPLRQDVVTADVFH